VRRALVAGALLAGLGAAGAFALRAEPIGDTLEPAARIVFVCRNGVAMSVWSAAYFNRLAAARGLRERAVARAAVPSFTAVPFRMRVALALDGFRVGGFRPHVVSATDVRDAALVVTIDDELPDDARAASEPVEAWSGFPPMRERYFPSRAALKERIEALVERLAEGAHRTEPRSAFVVPGSRGAR
jgi:hypothetical protein